MIVINYFEVIRVLVSFNYCKQLRENHDQLTVLKVLQSTKIIIGNKLLRVFRIARIVIEKCRCEFLETLAAQMHNFMNRCTDSSLCNAFPRSFTKYQLYSSV